MYSCIYIYVFIHLCVPRFAALFLLAVRWPWQLPHHLLPRERERVLVCVCVRKRGGKGERERTKEKTCEEKREKERERARERQMSHVVLATAALSTT